MGLSGFPVIIESQAIMVSTRLAIGKLIHALEVWSDDPRLPNIEPLQHEPSTADSTAIQLCIGQYIGPGKDFDGLHRKFRRRKFRAGAANFDEIAMLSP